jgi:nitrate reductase molybdenum cofactor assembly chaperone
VNRRPKTGLTPHDLTIAWQSVSLLLDYPDAETPARLDLIRDGSQRLPVAIGDSIRGFADHLERTPLARLQAEYVETFDNRRRCNLFLTYFAHGDTRKRGLALLRFKQTYLSAGYELNDSELPDHLCVVVPYICLTTFVVGHVWRYRYDKFGWTTRSSQIYENRLLRIGSPLFHFGMLGVVGGHIIGLLVPQSWTDAVGISEHTYHVVAVVTAYELFHHGAGL